MSECGCLEWREIRAQNLFYFLWELQQGCFSYFAPLSSAVTIGIGAERNFSIWNDFPRTLYLSLFSVPLKAKSLLTFDRLIS
jgi:hypothetical protein